MKQGLLIGILLFVCGLTYSSQPLVNLSSSPTRMSEVLSWQNPIQSKNFSTTRNSARSTIHSPLMLANLSIAKTVSNSTPNVGDTITFTVTLTNSGTTDAAGVEVTDLLPAGLTFVNATPSAGSYDSGTGLWTVGTVTTVTPQTLLIQATVASPTPQTNTATITQVAAPDSIPPPPNNSASVTVTPQQADLGLTKLVSNPIPNVGDTVTFTVTLSNLGPNTATNVTVTDLLPAGLTFVSSSQSAGSYNSGTGLWTVGTVTPGLPQTLTIQASVVSPTPQTNTATITQSDQFDPNPANNTASATVTPQQADLALTKLVSNSTPNVGDTVTFTVTLANLGPDTATNVTVTDLLPAGLTFVSATPSAGSYNSGTGLWTVGTVTPGLPQTLTIQASVVSPTPQTNTAIITHSDQFDPNIANNTASSTVTPQQADLALTKLVSNSTPNVGDTVTFTVTLSNLGPNTATNVTVADLLPAGLTFVSATPSAGSYNSGTGLWTVGTVNIGSPHTLTIQATVVSPTPQTNTATITHSDQFDPNPANNTASATVTPQQADLALTKLVSNPTPTVGDTVTFTVTLSNLGPNTATNVTVTDLLPAGLTFVNATPSAGSYNSGTGLWTVGTVTTGLPQTLSIQATVTSSSTLTNTATITHSDQFDPNPANNTASATITSQQADLALTKLVSNSTPNVGDIVTFTVTLSNLGPDTATNVTVTDLLPAGLTFISATPTQGSYNSGTGLWTVGTVTTGLPQTLSIHATVASPTPQINTATITQSDQFDPNPANNTASATISPQQADLALTKSVSNPTPTVGDTVTFTVTLSNLGPNTATNVTVTDLLPAGLTFVSATPSAGSYNSGTGLWTVGTVTTGLPQTLSIQASVVSPTPQTNTATITQSDQFDPNTANNTASVTINTQQADLALTKSVSNPTPNVGDTVTFTVTLSNLGPNTATNVTVTDLLPAGLTFVSATPSAGSYNSGTGLWTVGTVTTATPQTLTIQASVTSPTPQTNTATITHSDQFDPNTANNTASVTINAQQADLALTKSVSTSTPTVGDTVTFTVTLSNLGPDTATNVTVTDLLPAGLTFVSATPSAGSYNSGTGLWTVGTVTTGLPQTLLIQATVVSSGTLTNTATITHSDQFDPNPANNTASIALESGDSSPDITLLKSASVTYFSTPNTSIVYSYLVTNSGNSTLTNVIITDSQPGLSAIICPVTTLAPGEQQTCTATYLTTLADMQQGQITNLATVNALAPNGITVQAQSSVTVKLDVEFIRKKTMAAIRNFLNARAQLVLSDEPDKRRIINRLSLRNQNCSGKPQGSFQPNNDQMAINASLSLSELCMPMNNWDIWSEIHGSYYEQNRREFNHHGDFGIAYLGIDYLLNSSVVFGVLGEGDIINQNGSIPGAQKANGQGWMIGPYLSTRLLSNLYLHTRAAWGGSNNKINVFNLYNDSFNTTRSLYNAELVGESYYAPWRISPTLGISYYSELQKGFTNYLAIAIPGQRINLGQINIGPEFAYLITMNNNKEVTLRLSLQGLYNFGYHDNNNIDDEIASINRYSSRVKLGAEFRSPSGFIITPMINYNGFGGPFYNSIDGQLQVSVPFN